MAVYNELRMRWNTRLIGGSSIDNTDADIAAYKERLSNDTSNAEGTGIWDRMSKTADAHYLWEDIIHHNNMNSAAITKAYRTIRILACAYSISGTSQFNNRILKNDIITALEWMYRYQYNEHKNIIGNWYDWEIGTPQALMDIMVLLYNELTTEQLGKYLHVIDTFVPNPLQRVQNANVIETGANLLDKALVVILRGIVGKQSVSIEQARSAMIKEFLYVKSGDGIYEDGSLVQHYNIAYTGSYGAVLLEKMTDLLYLTNESPWQNNDPNVKNVYQWIEDSFEPLIYKGAMMDSVRGRGISRQADSDHQTGRKIIGTIARLAEEVPEEKATPMKRMIKEWMQADSSFTNYFENMPLYEMKNLKAILNDATITPHEQFIKHQQFAGMDRVVHLRPTHGFALSMFSDRISIFEYGNGENRKGWFTGLGMTSLYNEDVIQYSNHYWPTVDMSRLAGITTDGYMPTPHDWGAYFNAKDWVGGCSLAGLYGAIGMDFSLLNSTGSPLQGKKSWFMFDDEIVALGSSITSPHERTVETIVENRQITDEGTNKLIVDGVLMPNMLGWEEKMNGISWAHLAGNTSAGSDIGYYFPIKADIVGKREARSGSWHAINDGGSPEPITRNYISLSFDHGAAPKNGCYAYVLLPNKDVAMTEHYSSNPDIEILSQSDKVHAVRNHKLRITSFNFWEAGAVDFVHVQQPASVMVRHTENDITIVVSDPTQKQHQVIIELEVAIQGEITKDATVTVLQTSPCLKLEINTEGSVGKSHTIQFKKR